jgi:hypothetical protein
MAYLQRRLEKRFDFRGEVVHQTNVVGDSSLTFDKVYTMPVYAFSEIETIVRSLPFRPHYSAVVPLYSEGDDAVEMDSLAVVNDRPGTVWTVRFADPAVVATYGVDASSRRIVNYEVTSRKTRGRARKVFG